MITQTKHRTEKEARAALEKLEEGTIIFDCSNGVYYVENEIGVMIRPGFESTIAVKVAQN